MTRVSISSTRVIKTFASGADAARAIVRARALRAAGLPTPTACACPTDDRRVSFERIEGESLPEPDSPATRPIWKEALRIIGRLHGLDPGAVDTLPPHDPLTRIRGRLTHHGRPWMAHVLDRSLAMVGTCSGGRAPVGPVHGDLHPGQFLADEGGSVWIIDLDDMAIGHPEADLANLAAHAATHGPQRGRRERFRICLDAVGGFAGDAGITFDPQRLLGHAYLALIRRALKADERADPETTEALGCWLPHA
jgi:aminoglycoside phosphotransferase (APT) family kinase protein